MRPIGKAELAGKPTSGIDGGCREVQSDDRGAALRKSQGVGAEMALQVQDAAAGDRPKLRLFNGIEGATPGPQVGKIVAARAEMERDLFIPMGTIGRPPYRLAHTTNRGRTIPRWPCCRRR